MREGRAVLGAVYVDVFGEACMKSRFELVCIGATA